MTKKWMVSGGMAMLSGFLLLTAGCSSFDRLQNAAERGDPSAQFAMAEHYRKEDPTLSAIWLRRSAEQGFPEAMVEFGRYCLDGFGVEQDRDAAIEWWRKAALEQKNLEAARLLGELLLPDPPLGRAELAVAAYGVLLADPACRDRRELASRLLSEGEKLRLSLRLADRREELAAVEKQFTQIFQQSVECFDLSKPAVLELMDKLSDETYRLPPLAGKPPVPVETEGLRPEYAALLSACDRLETDELPALMAEARKKPDFQEFLSMVPELIVPMFFGRPELYGGISAGRSFYDFALFGSYMKPRREFHLFQRSYPVLSCRTSVQDGEGEFLFGLPGLEPVSADTPVKYGKCELFGVRILFPPFGDFKAVRAGVEKEYGRLVPVEHTFDVIRESRPYLVRITVPALERKGGKLHVLLTDNVKPLKVELLDLIPGTSAYDHWEEYIAMNSVDGIFTWRHENAEHYLTAENAYERLKLKDYEKDAFIEQIKREYFPGRMLEVIDVRRDAVLTGAAAENDGKEQVK